MPTPERTSVEQIVAAARAILEDKGPAGLTMQSVAEHVGVRAPSLYKRVRNRDDLIRLAAQAAVRDFGSRLHAVPVTADRRADLGAMAREFRAFAHTYPAAYRLVLGSGSVTVTPELDQLAEASAPVLCVAADLAGPEHALEAARTLTAWIHGFVSMELAGAFNLGGDVERAFEFGLTRLGDALALTP